MIIIFHELSPGIFIYNYLFYASFIKSKHNILLTGSPTFLCSVYYIIFIFTGFVEYAKALGILFFIFYSERFDSSNLDLLNFFYIRISQNLYFACLLCECLSILIYCSLFITTQIFFRFLKIWNR